MPNATVCVCVCVCAHMHECTLSPFQLSVTRGCSHPGSTVHGIFQAGTQMWIAISSSRGSWTWSWKHVSCCIAGGLFTCWAIREARQMLLDRIRLDRTKGLVGILNRTKCLLTTVITIIRSEGREQFLENRCKSLNFCRNSLEKMDAEEKKSNNNYTFQYSACTPN